jgi:hypothetical protein
VQFFTSVNGGAPQAIAPPINLLPTQPQMDAGASIRATLPTGTNVVTALYSGDQDFNPVTTAPVTIVVTSPDFTVSSDPSALAISAGGSTTDAFSVTPILGFSGAVSLSCASGAGPSSTLVVVGSSTSKVASGTAVTFTAQVSGGNKTPTGSVTFFDGTTVLGNAVALSNGQASLSVSNLTVGTHSITAAYSGDSSHTASASQAYYEAVTGTTTLQVVATSASVSHTLNVQLTVQ